MEEVFIVALNTRFLDLQNIVIVLNLACRTTR